MSSYAPTAKGEGGLYGLNSTKDNNNPTTTPVLLIAVNIRGKAYYHFGIIHSTVGSHL